MLVCSSREGLLTPNFLPMTRIRPSGTIVSLSLLLLGCLTVPSFGDDSAGPESVLRTLVRANAEKDLETISKLIAHDAGAVGYTIGGRKYVGWPELEREMQEEFHSVAKLELPIMELKVWTKGETAWFAMELDYIRYVGSGSHVSRTVIPLRETGVLERRNERWILVAWHESPRSVELRVPSADGQPESLVVKTSQSSAASDALDLSGDWEILEVEDNKTYKATLDRTGNGPYTWQGGRITTTTYTDRRWHGTWQQTGNDREGGFEVVLSEDSTQAKGIWWYTRVGQRNNIPAREHGGTYLWKRLTPPPPQIP